MNKEKIINILKNAAAIVVFCALLTIILYQNRDRDIFGLRAKETGNEPGTAQTRSDIAGDGASGDICRVGDGVAVITPSSFSVLNIKGEGKPREIAMPSPVISGSGDYVVYHNADDKEAFVCKRERPRYSVKTDNRIIRAKVTRGGYSVIVTEKEGYSSEIIVYDGGGDAVFKWDVSKSEFLDADADPDRSRVALSQLSAGESGIEGEIVLLDMKEAKVLQKKTFKNKLFYNIKFNRNGTYTALGSDSLAYFNRDGSVKWEKKYGDRTLLKADISQPDMMVLAFSAAGSGVKGNSTELEVVGRLGKVTAKRTMNGLADAVSASGSEIAAAFGKKVYVMDNGLKTERKLEAGSSVKKLEFFGDNKHLFVLGNSGGEIMK